MPHPRSISPVDEDLQALYNEVWASFAEEPISQNGYHDQVNRGYPAEASYRPSPTQTYFSTPSSNGSLSYGPTASARDTRQSIPSPKSSTVRRLPPTPGSSSVSNTSPTHVFAMPEPEPYMDPHHRPGHFRADSHSSTSSNDLRRKVAATNANGRRLPTAPSSNGGASSSFSSGRALSYASYESGSSSGGYSNPVSRESSYRPSGALPPATPGQQEYPTKNMETQSINPDQLYQMPVDYYEPRQDYTLNYPPRVSSSNNMPQGVDPYSLSQSSHVNRSNTYPSTQVPYDAPRSSPPSSTHTFNTETSYNHNTYDNGSSTAATSVVTHQPPPTPPPPPSRYNLERHPSDMLRTLAGYGNRDAVLDVTPEPQLQEEDYWEDEDDEDESRFINISLLSHMAVQLRDKVPRADHTKGGVQYERAFTGKDIVSAIQSQIQRELAINHGMSTNDRRAALQVARSLQSQLFFSEVEWDDTSKVQDNVEDVYNFLGDLMGVDHGVPEELPTGVVTMLTRCYSPSCAEGVPCYSYTCPRKGKSFADLARAIEETTEAPVPKAWEMKVGQEITRHLSETEIQRQNIIHNLIEKEEQYVQDLDVVEMSFIRPLRKANPPIVNDVDEFIDDVFGSILDLRECNRRLIEVMYVRQREEGPVIQAIGDVMFDAAVEFRLPYPAYIGHHPIAEMRLRDEMERNSEFKLFIENCSRQFSRNGDAPRLDLKRFLNRPTEHLQKLPGSLEAILKVTEPENADYEALETAIEAIKSLQAVAQLATFQSAMGRGAPGKWEWHDLVSAEIMQKYPKGEIKRQAIIFELIKGEMSYVKDLESISNMYIVPLRTAEPPIIPQDRVETFIHDVFHNFRELFDHHSQLVKEFHRIQREQHPIIGSIIEPLTHAALQFREAYQDYIPNYPIAAYRIDDEMANNPAFKAFVESCVRHPDAHRLDMKNFINRPIPRLLRYELLLKGILEQTPADSSDIEQIPETIDLIKSLGKETEPGVAAAKQKVEVWRYNSNLLFKSGENVDMDLLSLDRSLIHSGKLLRQPESGLEWNGWSELFVLLFDNYMVMTKPKERDGIVKYQVNRRPVPLDLLTLVNFTEAPTQRSTGILRGLRGGGSGGGGAGAGGHADNPNGPGVSPDSSSDSRNVYPLTLHHNGRTGGTYILYAESAQARLDWKQKLEEALVLRKVVQESNKAFEPQTLSADTFLIPSMMINTTSPGWNQDNTFTGKVTCSVPFTTPNGRPLVAIGCAEGVWIGYQHDPKSMRRVLHLKMVTQCAMLEEFGIFIVLADKSLFAYHIEALVPTQPQSPHNQNAHVPQKLNGNKDVHFFSVGTLHGRTLVIYMKKKGLESIFRVLEPVGDKINEKVKAPVGFGSRLGFRSAKSEWFRVYRDFFLPSEAFDLVFLKARIVVLCAKGFEIMDLHDFSSTTVPAFDDTRIPLAKRCEGARPMGMFRSNENEFLLCYDEFGLYVDKHGEPSRQNGTVEWEGTAERVALHAPYFMIFDTRFIEIRDLTTGRLVQIIPGNDVRCIWDGRGVSSSVMATPAGDHIIQEAQVHAVMNAETSPAGASRSKAVAQCVVELIPTIPLTGPGPLAMQDRKEAYFHPSQYPPSQYPLSQHLSSQYSPSQYSPSQYPASQYPTSYLSLPTSSEAVRSRGPTGYNARPINPTMTL
ncbi:Rho1 guanine nucleotide exchange factor 1 [Termitomyces sp. J132]|nr:Rho1 guanine nucleotide exchange factor 1 [Termitomyces sp. J132]